MNIVISNLSLASQALKREADKLPPHSTQAKVATSLNSDIQDMIRRLRVEFHLP